MRIKNEKLKKRNNNNKVEYKSLTSSFVIDTIDVGLHVDE